MATKEQRIAQDVNNRIEWYERTSVQAFWEEFEELFVWDLLPYKFLYALYNAWYKRQYKQYATTYRNATFAPMGRNTFIEAIDIEAGNSNVFQPNEPRLKTVRSQNRMQQEEPLTTTYKLHEWADTSWSKGFRGLVRRPDAAQNRERAAANSKNTTADATTSAAPILSMGGIRHEVKVLIDSHCASYNSSERMWEAMAELQEAVNRRTNIEVVQARLDGVPWTEIGGAFGITAQEAARRWLSMVEHTHKNL